MKPDRPATRLHHGESKSFEADNAGAARRRAVAARRLIDEIHRALLLNQDAIAASLRYGRIVYRRNGSNQLDIQFSTKLGRPNS